MRSEEAITRILNAQVSGYKALLELLQKERLCLIDFNAASVEELAKEKDTMILKLRLLEEERLRLMRDFGNGTMTLQALGELTGNPQFFDLRSKLKSLLQAIEELNNFNRVLIERSLSYCRSNSGFFNFFGIGEKMPMKGTLLSMET
ncbi:MAG: flagellar protein FlgN [Nitrospirales bacterium]|nr:flagellar protein FlgN [Nitrospirales bacterium]